MKSNILMILCAILSITSSAQVNLTNGLMLHLPFNGNANDAGTNGNHGIVYGATLTAGESGMPNTAYAFNGSTDYIRVPNSATLNFPNDSFSTYALVKPMGFYAGPCHGNDILDKGDADYIQGWYCLRFADGPATGTGCTGPVNVNVENFYAQQSNVTTTTNYTPYIDTGVWYCVISIYDGTTVKVYKDGILVSTETVSGSLGVNNHDLYLGRKNDATFPYWFNGVMDEIRLYNRVLNTEEIDSLCSHKPTSPESVADTKPVEPLQLYPNPVDQTMTLFLTNEELGGQLTITDMTGNLLMDIADLKTTSVSLTHLAAGIYIVQYTRDDLNLRSKLLKK